MVKHPKVLAATACATIALLLTSCGGTRPPIDNTTSVTGIVANTLAYTQGPETQDTMFLVSAQPPVERIRESEIQEELDETEVNPWTQEELDAIALTLAGECYDDKVEDKRKVCEVILNRVSDERFDDTICAVITAKNQFLGYWNQSREVSENDRAVAEATLRDWYANDCKPLSQYRFFCAGSNRENVFFESID